MALGIAVAVALPGAALAAGDYSLTLTRADVPGFKAAGGGANVSRAALGRKLPEALKRSSARGAAFRAGSRRLIIGVFTPGSRSEAKRALRQARRGFQRLERVGDAALARTKTGRRRTEATVLLRSGDAVGAVTLRLRGRGKGVRRLAGAGARAYATSLAARVRRVRSVTAWERNLDGIAADGSITPQLALRAFAITYGSLPGVKRPRGRLGAPDSGTFAINLVARVWDRLTRAQQAAIDSALGVRHNPSAPPVARSADDGATLTEDPVLEGMAKQYIQYYSARMPTVAVPAVKVYTTPEDLGVDADALPIEEPGSPEDDYCRVRVTPQGMASFGTQKFDFTLAHELFHCFEYNMFSFATGKPKDSRGAWLLEGLADWAAIRATGFVNFTLQGLHYPKYLKTPGKPLFEREYDAVGFWGRAEEFGGVDSLWPKIPHIMAEPDPGKAYALAGGTQPGFLATWASAAWRMQGAGDSWTQLSPYLLSPSKVPTPATPIIGSAALKAAPLALSEYLVIPDANRPLVDVLGSGGYLRAGTVAQDFGLIFGEVVNNGWFCFADKCDCPGNSASAVPTHRSVGDHPLALALTGGPDHGEGAVYYHTVDEFCEGTSPTPVPPTGLSIMSQDPRYPGRAITTPGQCFLSSAREDGTRAWVLNFDGFQIAAPVFTGAGQYTLLGALNRGPLSPYANASTAGVGPWYTSAVPAPGAGSFTVAKGLRSGTVSATFWAPGDPPIADPLTVSGNWSCVIQDGPFPGLPLG
jgi:hypothetical protein